VVLDLGAVVRDLPPPNASMYARTTPVGIQIGAVLSGSYTRIAFLLSEKQRASIEWPPRNWRSLLYWRGIWL
jgi:hypothetical protein